MPRVIISFLLPIVFAAGAAAQSVERFHFTEQPGSYPVGVRVVEQYDPSRSFGHTAGAAAMPVAEERGRPLQTLIWYPAVKGPGKTMTVSDYSELTGTETSFGKPDVWPVAKAWIAGLAPALRDSLWAVRGAAAAPGRFPAIIYAPSFSATSWENADLCEYLASFGYVVIATPDMGETTRGMTRDLAGANAQAMDISFLIGYAATLPNAEVSRIAVIGFSWGGLSNLLAAARDKRITALVSIDGSMRYRAGLVEEAGDVHPEKMTLPLLFFTQGEINLEDMEKPRSKPYLTAPSVLNRWTHGDLVLVHNMALFHEEHSSMFQRNEQTWTQYAGDQKNDYVRSDGIPAYAWRARYTLKFLDAYVKQDADALAYLKKTPVENGAPRHLITVTFRAAQVGH